MKLVISIKLFWIWSSILALTIILSWLPISVIGSYSYQQTILPAVFLSIMALVYWLFIVLTDFPKDENIAFHGKRTIILGMLHLLVILCVIF